jgi:hypothetical protein
LRSAIGVVFGVVGLFSCLFDGFRDAGPLGGRRDSS